MENGTDFDAAQAVGAPGQEGAQAANTSVVAPVMEASLPQAEAETETPSPEGVAGNGANETLLGQALEFHNNNVDAAYGAVVGAGGRIVRGIGGALRGVREQAAQAGRAVGRGIARGGELGLRGVLHVGVGGAEVVGGTVVGVAAVGVAGAVAAYEGGRAAVEAGQRAYETVRGAAVEAIARGRAALGEVREFGETAIGEAQAQLGLEINHVGAQVGAVGREVMAGVRGRGAALGALGMELVEAGYDRVNGLRAGVEGVFARGHEAVQGVADRVDELGNEVGREIRGRVAAGAGAVARAARTDLAAMDADHSGTVTLEEMVAVLENDPDGAILGKALHAVNAVVARAEGLGNGAAELANERARAAAEHRGRATQYRALAADLAASDRGSEGLQRYQAEQQQAAVDQRDARRQMGEARVQERENAWGRIRAAVPGFLRR